MASCWSRGVGQYVASETHRACWHRLSKTGARLLVFVPGSHSTADSTFNSDRADMEALARAGYVVAIGDISQTLTQGTFGNSTSQSRIASLRTFMQGTSSPLRAAAGKMHMVAGSGGVAAMLNYARANPTNVASMVGLLPLLDLQDLYENRTDATVTQAEINAAYGGNVTASYATHNPSASGNQAALAGIPLKLYYSTNDSYIPVATVTTYKSLLETAGGTCEIESLGAVGHTDTGLAYDDPNVSTDVADFLRAHPA
jgi:hypothetical protein